MYRTDFWTLWEKVRVGCLERTASKHVYYQGWNKSPAQVGCMRQVLGAGALGRPRGIGWRGRWEWGSGWGTHVNPQLIHVNVWQKPLQYCKVISLQLIKINGKKNLPSLFIDQTKGRVWCVAIVPCHLLMWQWWAAALQPRRSAGRTFQLLASLPHPLLLQRFPGQPEYYSNFSGNWGFQNKL